MPDQAVTLNALLEAAGEATLAAEAEKKFETYLALILKWNGRINLTAIRNRNDILSRHFVESIACARALPDNLRNLLDFGSGGGFPGVPIAICRPAIDVTLAESQSKKAAFLMEVVRTLGLRSTVFSGRAEFLQQTFDCVALRAVDRMLEAVVSAVELVRPNGWLAVMTTEAEMPSLRSVTGPLVSWREQPPLRGTVQGVLALGLKKPKETDVPRGTS